ncbi:MAG: hypothetical protein H6740_25570 [Alphaproteobacteria bacterium]|nr:hypothetical protein [Alphaproteobacteria bacterium]
MTQKQIAENYHFQISLSRALFSDLLGAALPFRVGGGPFNLVENARQVARQLQVKEKVSGLLTGPENAALIAVRDRARDAWGARRERVYAVVNDLVKIEGEWEVQVDRDGSEFTYATQEIGADAYFKARASGTATLLRENIEIPFTLEKRAGAKLRLGNIHYDGAARQVVGELRGVGIDLGDNVLLKLANDLVSQLLVQQTERFNPVPILKKDQLDELVGGAGSALKLRMEVTDVALDIEAEQATLKVRFGFSQLQLEDK